MANANAVEEAIERAYRHVSSGWVPPQPEVLSKISGKLNRGAYNERRAELANDLKEDFALYVYCVRELSLMVDQHANVDRFKDPQATAKRLSPAELLEQASEESLRAIFSKSEKEISQHSIAEMNQFQALRFRESMLSATTAEVLAEKNEIDPEIGFSCGVLRQLGLTLIAWNYPRVFSRAMETMKPQESLDFVLQRSLGFSPALLGLTFARRWNLSEDVLIALGDRKVVPSSGVNRTVNKEEASRKVGEVLAKLCEVGEALARANNPEHYPNALRDWQDAEEAIAAHLGPKGMHTIFERAELHCQEYLKLNPEITKFTPTENLKEKIVDSRFATAKLEKNQYLKNCPPHLREQIVRLYHQLKPNKILKKNLRTFVFEILPAAGFSRGCIFMLDPTSKTLSPSITIGELSTDRIKPVKLSSVLGHFDLVSSAFGLKAPLREEGMSREGERMTMIATALGTTTPLGVLYLETDDDVSGNASADPMPVFRALKQTLSDCLNLS